VIVLLDKIGKLPASKSKSGWIGCNLFVESIQISTTIKVYLLPIIAKNFLLFNKRYICFVNPLGLNFVALLQSHLLSSLLLEFKERIDVSAPVKNGTATLKLLWRLIAVTVDHFRLVLDWTAFW
jgi:hypothetical protein